MGEEGWKRGEAVTVSVHHAQHDILWMGKLSAHAWLPWYTEHTMTGSARRGSRAGLNISEESDGAQTL